jgi:hypothetical protein
MSTLLYCNGCNWLQDEFWDNEYNPIRELLVWENDLFDANWDKPIAERINMLDTLRNMIVYRLEWSIRHIREMEYRTMDEFKQKNPDGLCPVCGNKLTIDSNDDSD